MQSFEIKRGLENCPAAKTIREEIFMKEQGFQIEFDEIDPIAWHLLVYLDGSPVATGRLYEKEGRPGTYLLGRIAVMKPWRGRHLGEFVVRRLEEFAQMKGAKFLELSAQMQAKEFYEKLGYQAHGSVYLDEHCPHIAMSKAL